MRRAALTIVSTVAGLVVLLSFKTSSPARVASAAVVDSTTDTTSSTTTGTGTTTTTTTGGSSSGTTTITGSSVDTRYGPVQVKVTVTNGKVTAADAVVYPENDRRDQEINSYAVPELDQEALAASSANIQTISGATYTSDGYIQSLQSALDKAGL